MRKFISLFVRKMRNKQMMELRARVIYLNKNECFFLFAFGNIHSAASRHPHLCHNATFAF